METNFTCKNWESYLAERNRNLINGTSNKVIRELYKEFPRFLGNKAYRKRLTSLSLAVLKAFHPLANVSRREKYLYTKWQKNYKELFSNERYAQILSMYHDNQTSWLSALRIAMVLDFDDRVFDQRKDLFKTAKSKETFLEHIDAYYPLQTSPEGSRFPEFLAHEQNLMNSFDLEVGEPEVKFLFRHQKISETDLPKFLDQGFLSVARSINTAGIEQIEASISRDYATFFPFMRSQKAGIHLPQGFPPVFVEASASKQFLNSVVSSGGDSMVLARIRSEGSISTMNLPGYPLSYVNSIEAGHMFLGAIPPTAMERVIWKDPEGYYHDFQRNEDNTAWNHHPKLNISHKKVFEYLQSGLLD